MNPKTLVVALIVAATLSVPARTEAARTAETSQLLLPAVGLVAGLISAFRRVVCAARLLTSN